MSLITLIALCIAWELWLAPLRPGGSWLFLKAVPLLFPLRGILSGRLYTYRWTSLLTLVYFGEGLARASSDKAPSSWCGAAEVFLALTLFSSIVVAIRWRGRQENASIKPAD